MTEDIVLLIKDIVDRAGLDVSLEQIETGLDDTPPAESDRDPWQAEIIGKIEAEQRARGPEAPEGEGRSLMRWGNCYVLSGTVEVEYSGRSSKKYEGGAVLLLKPDHSVVVHGLRGVVPVSYLARAGEVGMRGKEGRLTIEAVAGDERLTVTFLKIEGFERLFREAPAPAPAAVIEKPVTDQVALTKDEKVLEARLKQLRIDLARREGISYLPAVFDNRMLRQVVRQRPKTVEDLRRIKGFGAKRIERYATSLLEAISAAPGDSPVAGPA